MTTIDETTVPHGAVAPAREETVTPPRHDATASRGQEAGAPDPDRLGAFLERYAVDQAAALHAATVVVGDRLGLYAALADGGPLTAAALAARTGCHPRLVREWCNAQVASAYCAFDDATDRYWLTPEQAACLADPSSRSYVLGGALTASSNHKDTDRVVEAFRSDGGIGWGDHHHELFEATRRFFEPVYRANLVDAWVPALDGVHDKLTAGGHVADVGCGEGTALLLLAEAYPASTFAGFDYHGPSIDEARRAAAAAGVGDRVTFEVAGADDFPGRDYDLVCVLNALHELGAPVDAARRIRDALATDGTWMFTEPRTDDRLQESVRGRTFYSASTFVCTPSALSQDGGHALGAQAGEAALRQVAEEAGFSRFRRATETPTFMVLEARP
jgi:SAM-dependent methyltransferase